MTQSALPAPTAATQEKTHTAYRPISAVSVSHIRQMYRLYEAYYENTALDTFLADLSRKSGVIMVTRAADDQVVGFSTQTIFNLTIDGKKVRGIFSGDTIIDKPYWGNNKLGVAFYRLLVKERLRRPFTPFYWFLISKGYKTYLLMTNNCYHYYPNVAGPNEKYRRITEQYCQQLFPEAFDKDKMLLDFGDDYVRLKSDVADITPELAQTNEKIEFFEQANPTWRRGTELPCLGAIDYSSVFMSLYLRPWKWIQKNVLRQGEARGLALARKIDAERCPPPQGGPGWSASEPLGAEPREAS